MHIEQIQERLQGLFTPSYISNNHSMDEIIYSTKEEPHVMVEHELHVDMQALKETTLKQEGNQGLVLVQRDYELPLGESAKPWRRHMISQQLDQPMMENMHSKLWWLRVAKR